MTTNKNSMESSQGDSSAGNGAPPPPTATPQPDNQQHSLEGNLVFKSGPLFISSKGIGWTSWKKRWFILTKTSLVFFRSDPNAIPQKPGEVNLTLGGIDLTNSGSVSVKADKKLITVQFSDGREGRTFTLKAETLEDMYAWQNALESALSQAPSASLMMGQSGIVKNEQTKGAENSPEELKEEEPGKFLVLGRPILLALEEVDGSPSFLEKALRFIEEHGINTEGILRQAADVEDVKQRIREYEQGKIEFSPEEDAHVIGDCIKYVLRELPSSPVPASCCNALIDACRTDRGNRVNAMKVAICETFPEPNRKLLQRILLMMRVVASNKAKNRMSSSAVSACMAPLLLRPLLAGECEIETDFDVGGDGSLQLLRAAAAANHAQAIVITLLEEYDTIFMEGSMSPGLYSDSEEYGSEDEELSDDYEDDDEESVVYTEDDYGDGHSGSGSGSGSRSASENESGSCDSAEDNLSDKGSDDIIASGSMSPEVDKDSNVEGKSSSSSSSVEISLSSHDVKRNKGIENARNDSAKRISKSHEQLQDIPEDMVLENKQTACSAPPHIQKSTTMSDGPAHGTRRQTVWGRTSAKKNLSMESIDFDAEEEVEIQKLEASKLELQNKISEEAKSIAVLEANLEQRKKSLHDRRMDLERDVARLQEQLQKERDKREALEAGLDASKRPLSVPLVVDEKIKADLEEIFQAEADVSKLEQRVEDLNLQLNQHRDPSYDSSQNSSNQPASNNQAKQKDKQKDSEAMSTSRRFGKSKSKSKGAMERLESNKKHLSQRPQNNIVAQDSDSKTTTSENAKRSNPRSEGSNSTSSALTKLTTRLNFLKERRTQITNEIQSMDKGPRGSGQAITSPPDTSQGSETVELSQNQDTSQNPNQERKGLEASQPLQSSDK